MERNLLVQVFSVRVILSTDSLTGGLGDLYLVLLLTGVLLPHSVLLSSSFLICKWANGSLKAEM